MGPCFILHFLKLRSQRKKNDTTHPIPEATRKNELAIMRIFAISIGRRSADSLTYLQPAWIKTTRETIR